MGDGLGDYNVDFSIAVCRPVITGWLMSISKQVSPMANFLYLLFFVLLTIAPLQRAHSQIRSADSTYFQNQLASFAKGNNLRRFNFIKKFPKKNNLSNLQVKTQGIDWLGLYRNVIVEKKGRTDSIVYIVCHYDKIDGNIFSFVNLMINGSLDILFSNTFLTKGAYDNGTGVATLLGLLEWIDSRPTYYTYRFLFAGMEEYGLRGSRRHVSSLTSKEWSKCVYAINIDMIAEKKFKGITVTVDVSDYRLVKTAERITERNGQELTKAFLPAGALSDFHSFRGQSFTKDFGISFMANVVGAFIPQRSYFTKGKSAIPVINFSDDTQFGTGDMVSIFSPVSFGTVHSLNDRIKRVSANNLVEYSEFFKHFITSIDEAQSLGTPD
jgi:hypothetical protein